MNFIFKKEIILLFAVIIGGLGHQAEDVFAKKGPKLSGIVVESPISPEKQLLLNKTIRKCFDEATQEIIVERPGNNIDIKFEGMALQCVNVNKLQCPEMNVIFVLQWLECMTVVEQIWSNLVEESLEKLRKQYTAPNFKMPKGLHVSNPLDDLNKSHRIWQKYKFTDCMFWSSKHGAGTLRHYGATSCRIDAFARRAIAYRSWMKK